MKYTFGAIVSVSVYTIVDADNEQDALEIAEQRDMQRLCFQCAGADDMARECWSLTGELDGLPKDIEVDK